MKKRELVFEHDKNYTYLSPVQVICQMYEKMEQGEYLFIPEWPYDDSENEPEGYYFCRMSWSEKELEDVIGDYQKLEGRLQKIKEEEPLKRIIAENRDIIPFAYLNPERSDPQEFSNGASFGLYDVVCRAVRLCRLYALDAPEVIINNEAKLLAQALVVFNFSFSAEKRIPEQQASLEHQNALENSGERLREICFENAYQLYGNPLPEIVQTRLEKELEAIIAGGHADEFLMTRELVRKSQADGYPVSTRGEIGGSLAAMLCGISEINPLKAHYRCPKCRHTDFHTEENLDHIGDAALDMPNEKCPICGTRMRKDGYDIPAEIFLGIDGKKVAGIALNLCRWYLPVVSEAYPLECELVWSTHLTLLQKLNDLTGDDYREIILPNAFAMGLIRGVDILESVSEKIDNPLAVSEIPIFETEKAQEIIQKVKPDTVSDFVRIVGCVFGDGVWEGNAECIVSQNDADLSDCICTRDDLLNTLIRKGIEPETAYQIMNDVSLGRVARGTAENWPRWEKIMKDANIPDWYIDSCRRIQHLWSKAGCVSHALIALRVAWYKTFYPQEFRIACSQVEEEGLL